MTGRLLDRGQSHGGAHVVGEDEEGAAVGTGEALERDPVEDHAHPVLADAEVQGAAEGAALPLAGLLALGDEGGLALHRRVVGLGEVGGAAPQLRHDVGEGGEHLAGRGARRDALRVGREGRQRLGETGRRLAGEDAVEQVGAVGVGLAPGLVCLVPLAVGGLAPLDDVAGVLEDGRLDGEGLLRVEAEQFLGGADLLVAEGRAVRTCRCSAS